MNLLEAMELELKAVNEIIVATRNLIAKKPGVLNHEQVRKKIRDECSEDLHYIVDLLLVSAHNRTRYAHAFGMADEGTSCSHPMGCKSTKLNEEEESILLKFKLQKLLDLFTFQKEHLLPESCGGTRNADNMKWWCALHNRQKQDALAWWLAEQGDIP